MNIRNNGVRAMLPPRIDSRDMQALIEQAKRMVPYYTPEWKFSPEDPDPGTALFFIVAEMLEENIKRLNRVPLKQFIAFLNMANVSLIPAKPAKAYVTFTLNEGTAQPVIVPAGTQLAAPSATGEEEIIFETEGGMLVTPASIRSLFNVSAAWDRIVHVPFADELPLFDYYSGPNLQEHVMYIKHDDLLHVKQGAIIRIEWSNTLKQYKEPAIGAVFGKTEWLEWSYRSAAGWTPFDEVRVDNNMLTLVKSSVGQLETSEVNGKEGRWIQCRIKQENGGGIAILNQDLEIDKVRMHTEYANADGLGGIPPEAMFYNDVQLDPGGCMPFGEHFTPLTAFYVSSPETFTKKKGLITMSISLKAVPNPLRTGPDPEIDWKMIMKRSLFEKKDPPKVWIRQVYWEYWNGTSWVRLETGGEAERLFGGLPEDHSERFSFTFPCPEDLEQTFVNSQYGYWIRARIMTMDQIYAPETVYMSPWIDKVEFDYRYGDGLFPVMQLLTRNNVEYAERTLQTISGGETFRPFYGIDGKYPSLYLGFDVPPVKGPIHMYISLLQQKYKAEQIPLIEWEYLKRQGSESKWATLKVIDDTAGFTQSGPIRFAGPSDFAEATQFDQTRYWIRAVNRDSLYETSGQPLPVARQLRMNTVKVVQHETIPNETPEWHNDYYALSRSPVNGEHIWVDETGHLTESEIEVLANAQSASIEVIRDSDDHIQRAWVRWQPTEHFLDSKFNDRHYMIDRSSGKFWFGDGVNGKVPPNEGPDKIKVLYNVTAGKAGNVEAGAITQLQNSIAFIQSVYNLDAAGGGTDTEPLEVALLRGPERFKHQQRAVTAGDFEWLTREAYPDIAKVKCLANFNVHMEKEVGCVTMVVLPGGGAAGQVFFPELKKQLEKYLLDRAAGSVAFPDKLQVIEPAYLEISITVTVVVQSMEDVIPTEIECMRKLNAFLDPLTGQYDGRGWEIGEFIHLSVFYALMKTISTVNHVDKLFMSLFKIENGKRTELDANRMTTIPNGIVVNGEHLVVVQTL